MGRSGPRPVTRAMQLAQDALALLTRGDTDAATAKLREQKKLLKAIDARDAQLEKAMRAAYGLKK